jgi:hypothetical protein
MIFCLFLQMIAFGVWGQPNYKKVYESIKTMKDYEAFQTLFAYQSATTSKDFVNVNGYYQMGLIAQKMMQQYDPFLQPQNMAQCITDAKGYLSLTLHYFNEREAKSNGQYYQATPAGQLNYTGIKKDIENRIKEVTEYANHFKQNSDYLTKGRLKYNACIETFGQINKQNSRLNDLYFLVDNELRKNLTTLQTNFDSTLYYLNKLKASLAEYPMGDFVVNYSLAPISVYRLHGLTAANFIAKEISLWDFSSWVNTFNEVLNTDVAYVYQQAEEVHKANLGYIAKLERSDKSGTPDNYAVNPAVLNKISAYDFNSTVAPLLKYQEEKIKLMYHNADNVVDKSLSALNNVAKSNHYYYDLILKKQKADSALILVTGKVTPEAIKKYNAFFTSNYKGIDGFKTYLQNEEKSNNTLLQTAIDRYKNNVWETVMPKKVKSISYKNDSLFINPVTPDRVGTAGYFIHSKSALANKKAIVSGSYVNPKSGAITAFAALMTDAGVEWLTTFDKKDGKTYGALTCETDNGFAVVVTTEKAAEIANYLYLIDNAGNVKKNVKLASTSVPRKILYDNIGETFLLTFKGTSFQPYAISNDALQVYKLKTDLTGTWKSELPFTGYVLNVIKTNDQFYVYGGYQKLTTADGKTVAVAGDKTNAFVYTLNTSGEWRALKTFDAAFSYFPLGVSKISNEYVDMIAVKAAANGQMEEKNSALYMIIASDNSLYYE